jgi:hypothetical protein
MKIQKFLMTLVLMLWIQKQGRLAHKVINIKAHPATAILKPQLGASVEIAGQWLKKSRTNVANKKSASHSALVFSKICLDPDVLELCIRNTSDIRNDHEDNSTKAFRKAAYRQFILARHGYLGKGNRRVCPSCVVIKIKERYPSVTGVYMGYREH